MILADENIDSHLVSVLRENQIEVFHIKEEHRGISDATVISLSKNPPRIILTEDKDFGEWVYAHQEKGENLFGKFTTITTKRIRIKFLK